jgi:hypothetical protein
MLGHARFFRGFTGSLCVAGMEGVAWAGCGSARGASRGALEVHAMPSAADAPAQGLVQRGAAASGRSGSGGSDGSSSRGLKWDGAARSEREGGTSQGGSSGTPSRAPRPLTVITIGTMIQAALAPGDPPDERGGPAHRYTVALSAGRAVTIVARGVRFAGPGGHRRPSLDPTIIVFENGAAVARDDGAAGAGRARVVFVPRRTGVYVVQVGAYAGAGWGAYTLAVLDGARAR